jgi:hypothetical protein
MCRIVQLVKLNGNIYAQLVVYLVHNLVTL